MMTAALGGKIFADHSNSSYRSTRLKTGNDTLGKTFGGDTTIGWFAPQHSPEKHSATVLGSFEPQNYGESLGY